MRQPEDGVILVNVLAVVALASAALVAMLSLQDLSIHRSQRFSEAAQATELARGGEASVVTAFRRDGVDAPDVDHLGEDWALVAEESRAIEGGTFRLTIEDAQAKFNINALIDRGASARASMRALLVMLEQPEGLADALVADLRVTGPISRLNALSELGVPSDTITALSPWVTALPLPSSVNLNTADRALISILLRNDVAARRLVAIRGRKGFLTSRDLSAVGMFASAELGFRTDHVRVRTEVSIGGTTQRLSSLLHRSRVDGRVDVVVIAREREMAASR